jgi:hypothetical protein
MEHSEKLFAVMNLALEAVGIISDRAELKTSDVSQAIAQQTVGLTVLQVDSEKYVA